jgi:NitT/TauT family transport system substrate-binding protein
MADTLKNKPDMISTFLKTSMLGWKHYLNGDRSAANALIKKDNPQMTDGQIDFAVASMKDQGMVTGGDASTQGIGIVTAERFKKTYDFMVAAKLLDPAKVKLEDAYDLRFVQNLKVLP